MKANGRLRHCFHGTYVAIVVLQFESPDHATSALGTLRSAWKVSDKNPSVLRWEGSSEELDAMKTSLARYDVQISPCGWDHCGKKQCADQPIDSLAHSIDYGPGFTVDVPPSVPIEQASLF